MASSAPTVRYLDTPAATDGFLAELSAVRDLALDTEGASFHRFVDRVYLLQLTARDARHGEDRHAIVDPLSGGTMAALGRLVEDPDVEIVFHDADYDLRLLHQDYGWKATHLFDTRIAAQLLGLKAFGLAALLEREFGVRLDKKHQRADWSMRPLSADMLDYAAQDTRWLLDLRDRLRDQLDAKGRLHWAREEFQRLEGTRWPDDDPATAFLRVKGARDLTRRELAILRELLPWRDGIARGLDRATFRVASNDVLMEIARVAPTTREALQAIKGVPRGSLEQRLGEMVDCVKRGLAVPEAELPRIPRGPRWDRDPDFDARTAALRTVRDEAAARLELDPGVLFSRERLEAVARRLPRTLDELAELPELRAWQIEVLGEAVLRTLTKFKGHTPAEPRARADGRGADGRSPYRDA